MEWILPYPENMPLQQQPIRKVLAMLQGGPELAKNILNVQQGPSF